LRLRRVIGGLVFVVLFAGGVVAANADTDNGVTATFSPANPNGDNGFYTSPVDITYEGGVGDTCNPASETYSGPNRTNATVSSTCTPLIGDPYTGTFTFKYDDRRPDINPHPDIERKTRGGPVDVIYQEPGATDDVDGNVAVTCSPPSGSSFPVGTTTVNCIARDNAGNQSSTSFTVTVARDEPPVVNVPGNQAREATGPTGAFVNYDVTANDPEDGSVAADCGPWGLHGDTFPLAPPPDAAHTTTVTCTATDSIGNTMSDSFSVTVRDTTSPAFTAPSPAPLEGNILGGYQATGPGEAYVVPTATDDVDGGVLVSCAPGPDSMFAVGSNPVTCSARDARNNETRKSFNVVVTDQTAPLFLVQPQDVTVQAANVNTGTPASNDCIQRFLNAPTANDVVDGTRPVTHNSTRTRFPPGSTTVTFTSTDTRNNSRSATAVVTVKRGDQGPCTIDVRAPRNPTHVKVFEGNHVVILTWTNPRAADFSHVDVYRQVASRSGLGVLVCRKRRPKCVDRGVRNGILYRYALFAYDEAGNHSRGFSTFAKPHRILLLRPRDGARISRPPVFDWVTIRGADYYNIQLYRMYRGRQVKILSRWPKRSQYDLAWRWRQDRRVRRFTPGHYFWYVWAGFGPLREGNYGNVMGPNDFFVVRRR
jgi:hypothetical protein